MKEFGVYLQQYPLGFWIAVVVVWVSIYWLLIDSKWNLIGKFIKGRGVVTYKKLLKENLVEYTELQDYIKIAQKNYVATAVELAKCKIELKEIDDKLAEANSTIIYQAKENAKLRERIITSKDLIEGHEKISITPVAGKALLGIAKELDTVNDVLIKSAKEVFAGVMK